MNPAIYEDIQFGNPHVAPMLERLVGQLQTLDMRLGFVDRTGVGDTGGLHAASCTNVSSIAPRPVNAMWARCPARTIGAPKATPVPGTGKLDWARSRE